ncbi:hypothetical protein JCM10207_000892 [Rhodosporidiobolus poonsookiae]
MASPAQLPALASADVQTDSSLSASDSDSPAPSRLSTIPASPLLSPTHTDSSSSSADAGSVAPSALTEADYLPYSAWQAALAAFPHYSTSGTPALAFSRLVHTPRAYRSKVHKRVTPAVWDALFFPVEAVAQDAKQRGGFQWPQGWSKPRTAQWVLLIELENVGKRLSALKRKDSDPTRKLLKRFKALLGNLLALSQTAQHGPIPAPDPNAVSASDSSAAPNPDPQQRYNGAIRTAWSLGVEPRLGIRAQERYGKTEAQLRSEWA